MKYFIGFLICLFTIIGMFTIIGCSNQRYIQITSTVVELETNGEIHQYLYHWGFYGHDTLVHLPNCKYCQHKDNCINF